MCVRRLLKLRGHFLCYKLYSSRGSIKILLRNKVNVLQCEKFKIFTSSHQRTLFLQRRYAHRVWSDKACSFYQIKNIGTNQYFCRFFLVRWTFWFLPSSSIQSKNYTRGAKKDLLIRTSSFRHRTAFYSLPWSLSTETAEYKTFSQETRVYYRCRHLLMQDHGLYLKTLKNCIVSIVRAVLS